MFENYQYINYLNINPHVIIISLCATALIASGLGVFLKKGKYKYVSIVLLVEWLFLYLCEALIFRKTVADNDWSLHLVYFLKPWLEYGIRSTLGCISYEILVFIPVGLLLSLVFHCLYPDSKRYGRVVFVSIAISLVIEILQYTFNVGGFYVSDIMFNAIGSVLGTLFHKLFLSHLWMADISKRIDSKNTYNKRIKFGIAIGEIKQERTIWILFIIASIVPLISYKSLDVDNHFLHRTHLLFVNLSYSYVAGFVIYFFTLFFPRINKIHKTKRQLEKTYSSIYTDLVYIAEKCECYDENWELREEAEACMINHLILQNDKNGKLCKALKTIVKEFTQCHIESKTKNNRITLDTEIFSYIKAMFSLIQTEVDNTLSLYSDGMNEEEIKNLNDFKHIPEKLFYSSLAGIINNEEVTTSEADLKFFVSDFIINLRSAKRLKEQYKCYNFYAAKKNVNHTNYSTEMNNSYAKTSNTFSMIKSNCAFALKWIFDRIVAFIGLVCLCWLYPIVALLIKIKMPGGSAFFVQKRVGKDGKLFKCHKFRTMVVNHNGSTVSVSGDLRITPLGAKLRHYKIDELPELWDVFIGTMSFVGPRPDVPGYADKLEGNDRDVLKLRPGITGPATLKYRLEDEMIAEYVSKKQSEGDNRPMQEIAVEYNDNVIYPDKVRLNCYYYRHYSFWKDIQMIFATVLGRKIRYAGEEI